MIHVGTPVVPGPNEDKALFYQRISFDTGKETYFLKKDIVNADSQMQSLKQLGVEIEYGYLSARKNPISLVKAGMRIRKLANKTNSDLVHVLWGATSSLITVMFSSKPVVISFCGSDLYGNYNQNGGKTISGRISAFFSILSSFFAEGIIVKSDLLGKMLPFSPSGKVTTIPNGVDLKAFFPIDKGEARERLNLSHDKKYVLFFNGSGAFVKNEPLARKVIENVQSQIPNVELLVVKNVVFEELVWYYNATDVMLLTSFHEGSNNSIKEAMACKLPIVSVNCGDAAFRLRNSTNSKVIDSWDSNVLAQELGRVLEKGERETGPDMCYEFEMNYVANSVLEVYKRILLN